MWLSAGTPEPASTSATRRRTSGTSRTLCAAADSHAGIDWEDIAEIVASLSAELSLAAIARRSPTSLAAMMTAQNRARHLYPALRGVLDMELRLASYLVRQPDFAEGVRAMLVDKDHQPRWWPDTLAAVDWTTLRAIGDS